MSLTNPLWPEQFEWDRGGAESSGLCGDNDLSLVVFGGTHAAHYLTGWHPLGCQQAVMAADQQTWDGREREKVKRARDTVTQWQCKQTESTRYTHTHRQSITREAHLDWIGIYQQV